MRDYQRKKTNPYILPKTLYRRVLGVIRDYDREKSEIDDILYGTGEHDGAGGGRVGKPTEGAAVRLLQYSGDVDAVEKALEVIPEEYRKAVFNNIRYGNYFPDNAAYRTWLRYRQRFIYEVAKRLNLV